MHPRKGDHDLGFWLSKEHLNETRRRAPGSQAEKRRTPPPALHFSHAALLRFEMRHEGCVRACVRFFLSQLVSVI